MTPWLENKNNELKTKLRGGDSLSSLADETGKGADPGEPFCSRRERTTFLFEN